MKNIFQMITLLCLVISMGAHIAFNGTGKTEINEHYLALAVEDIQASKTFYENIGFEQFDGKVEQNWVMLKNGTAKIGLFQDMFPMNVITFNPEDVRSFHQTSVQAEIPIVMANGMDKKEGPCSFIITDPDGNQILFDQHN